MRIINEQLMYDMKWLLVLESFYPVKAEVTFTDVARRRKSCYYQRTGI